MDETKTPPAPPMLKPLMWPPIKVDTHVTPDQMQAMVDRVEVNFRHMGASEPHWSVLTAERYRAANIGNNETEFFESGRLPVNQLLAALDRAGLDRNQFASCFELGCGVGRSTIWLAENFPSVIGADISAPHLKLARETCDRQKRDNVQLVQIERISTIYTAPPFDLFFSIIVLQHNPPPVIHAILSSAFDRLPSGGVAYFQVPTYRLGYAFDAAAYLATPVKLGAPEMHALPQRDLHNLIAKSDCRIIEMREDGAAGADSISNRLLVRKM